MIRIKAITAIFAVAGIAGGAQAQEKPAKASLCIGCHGAQGISPNPVWPNLARQNAEYIQKQLKDFRGQRRTDPMMSPIADQLTEAEITQLADYFSKLK